MTVRKILLAAVTMLALAASTSCSNTSEQAIPSETPVVPAGYTTTQYQLRNDMRMLWTQHVLWTRVVIIDMVANLPDAAPATQRLLQNQNDIGNAIRPFYGDAAADQLTSLLREHITGAADVVTAAKAGDMARLQTASAAWYDNADRIAHFLASANPNWPLADLQSMMRTHLDQTIAEATARLTHDWTGDVAAYDAIVDHILHMADTLSAGISAQFPNQVSATSGVTARGEDTYRAMRKLWEDHVMWTRVVIIDMLADLPDTPVATDRLLRNQDDIGNAFRPFYGNAAADQLTALLREHITGAAEVVAAAKAHDMARLQTASAAWYDNADRISDFLASANPNWPLSDLKAMMRTHLDQTTTEATSRLAGDWATDIATYDAIEAHILSMADTLSVGVLRQFPNGPGTAPVTTDDDSTSTSHSH